MSEFNVGETVTPKPDFVWVYPISARNVEDNRGLIVPNKKLVVVKKRMHRTLGLILKFKGSNYEYEAVFFELENAQMALAE